MDPDDQTMNLRPMCGLSHVAGTTPKTSPCLRGQAQEEPQNKAAGLVTTCPLGLRKVLRGFERPANRPGAVFPSAAPLGSDVGMDGQVRIAQRAARGNAKQRCSQMMKILGALTLNSPTLRSFRILPCHPHEESWTGHEPAGCQLWLLLPAFTCERNCLTAMAGLPCQPHFRTRCELGQLGRSNIFRQQSLPSWNEHRLSSKSGAPASRRTRMGLE